jgi:uncharacterized protein (TIGR03437 family)
MKLAITVSIVCFTIGLGIAQSQPLLTGVVNPASNIPPGLPEYGIAQGSIFVVYGAGLGPTSLIQASALPLPTTAGLAGTSISVTVGGTTVVAPMIYTLKSQVAAILPSTTPVGTGTINLTFNGATGSTPITVVATNFGLSTVNQSGNGAAVITRPDYSLVTNANSAKPGDVLVLWGTGLGPINGSDAVIPAQTDLGTPIQVLIGGIQANILYRGRSAGPGLDQINIAIPQGVSVGCSVSLMVQTGNTVSNSTSIPIASNGGQCSDPVNLLTATSTLTGKATYKTGGILLTNASVVLSANGQTTTTAANGASASFFQYTQAQINAQAGFPSLGSCLVTISPAGTLPTNTTPTALNAGTAITLTPPSGSSVSLSRGSSGTYSGTIASIVSGLYQASNGAGGPDVGPFKATFNAPAQPFVWTNQSAATGTIARTQPLNVQWSASDPAGFVLIDLVVEYLYGTSGTQVTAECAAPIAAGQFTIPASVLLNFPSSATGTTYAGASFAVYGYSAFQSLTIPGLDFSVAATVAGTTIGSVTYK